MEPTYRFRRELEELAKKKGKGTELVSVYIPSGYEITKVINKLAEEQGTASNIKSTGTRKNVITALERIIQHLKLFNETPKNGLVVFCGNVSETDRVDIQLYSIIPPFQNKLNLYRCEKQFILEPLWEAVESKVSYGLLVMDRREAYIGFLRGKRIDVVKKFSSMVPGKFRAGGQSAQRFERVIEGLANDFYKKIGENATNIFKNEKIEGVLVGGPGPTKNTFVEGEFLPQDIKKKILGILDVGYTDEDGLQEMVGRAKDIIQGSEVAKEKELIKKFLDQLAKGGNVSYGFEQVKKAIEAGACETVLISEGMEHKKADELVELAEKSGCKIEFISMDTREGQQLHKLGGVAAFLRYKYE